MLKHMMWLVKHHILIEIVAILQILHLVLLHHLSYLKVSLVLKSSTSSRSQNLAICSLKFSQLLSPVNQNPGIKPIIVKAIYSGFSIQAVQFMRSSQWMNRCCEVVMTELSARRPVMMEQQVCSLGGRWKRDPELCLRTSLTNQTIQLGLWRLWRSLWISVRRRLARPYQLQNIAAS